MSHYPCERCDQLAHELAQSRLDLAFERQKNAEYRQALAEMPRRVAAIHNQIVNEAFSQAGLRVGPDITGRDQ